MRCRVHLLFKNAKKKKLKTKRMAIFTINNEKCRDIIRDII